MSKIFTDFSNFNFFYRYFNLKKKWIFYKIIWPWDQNWLDLRKTSAENCLFVIFEGSEHIFFLCLDELFLINSLDLNQTWKKLRNAWIFPSFSATAINFPNKSFQYWLKSYILIPSCLMLRLVTSLLNLVIVYNVISFLVLNISTTLPK